MPTNEPAQAANPEPGAPITATPGAPLSAEQLRQQIEELRRENASWRTKLRTLEDAEKSSQEQRMKEQNEWKALAEKRELDLKAKESELTAERLGRLRITVAAEKGLPSILAERLVGITQEEIAADADRLLAIMPTSQQPTPPKLKAPNIDAAGVTPTAPNPSAVTLTTEELELVQRSNGRVTAEAYARRKAEKLEAEKQSRR